MSYMPLSASVPYQLQSTSDMRCMHVMPCTAELDEFLNSKFVSLVSCLSITENDSPLSCIRSALKLLSVTDSSRLKKTKNQYLQ